MGEIVRYDLHVHSHHSACSNLKPRMILKIARKRNLDGIAVADHDSMSGSIECRKLNRDKDFEVIPAAEIRTDHAEVLAYYLNQEITSHDFFDVIDKIHEQGALAVVAHPCAVPRQSLTLPWRNIKGIVDGAEVFNARSLPGENKRAYSLASKFGLAMSAGSDAHFGFEIGRAVTVFDSSLRTALKKRKTECLGSSLLWPLGSTLSVAHKRIRRVLRRQL